MKKDAKDPARVALILFGLLLMALLAFLLAALIRMKTPKRSTAPFIPPGWTNPTYPPPSAH
ncbi:MAG TPA: hypothetical protein VL283_05260 [Candidatus Baltobacteraceae bacterium]|jgi:hypothetical protein|nr:hypothetical protein [Candidatus Baltobacteraceae bacterium]